MTRGERKRRFEAADVYPVITGAFCAGRASLDVLEQALAGGARIVQLREKGKGREELLALAREFRRLCDRHQALFIVNDDVDLALASAADGVHLGQEDTPLSEARRQAPELILGQSTHNREEVLRAQTQDADYLNLGPVFATATKGPGMSALGLAGLEALLPLVKIPFTVMGGIHADNLEAVVRLGCRRVAMVTEITQAPDVAARVRELRRVIWDAAG
ncbi:MAG: thiamine phosphate synthase [candidate division FCPU426 bacterium]